MSACDIGEDEPSERSRIAAAIDATVGPDGRLRVPNTVTEAWLWRVSGLGPPPDIGTRADFERRRRLELRLQTGWRDGVMERSGGYEPERIPHTGTFRILRPCEVRRNEQRKYTRDWLRAAQKYRRRLEWVDVNHLGDRETVLLTEALGEAGRAKQAAAALLNHLDKLDEEEAAFTVPFEDKEGEE